jgi:hypothetical protein
MGELGAVLYVFAMIALLTWFVSIPHKGGKKGSGGDSGGYDGGGGDSWSDGGGGDGGGD